MLLRVKVVSLHYLLKGQRTLDPEMRTVLESTGNPTEIHKIHASLVLVISISDFQSEGEGLNPLRRSIVWVYNNKVTNSKLLTFLTLGLKENMLPVYIVPSFSWLGCVTAEIAGPVGTAHYS